jgi:hypothetical protein
MNEAATNYNQALIFFAFVMFWTNQYVWGRGITQKNYSEKLFPQN